jgi:hypothetical protein
MTDRELMEVSLEYLIEFGMGETPTAKGLRDRLAQPTCQENRHVADNATREWVDLDHIEIGNLWAEHKQVYSFAMELQKKLKERNHGL